MADFHLRGRDVVDRWMDDATPEQCSKMSHWIQAALGDPFVVCDGSFKQPGTGRTVWVAHVPGTGALVTCVIFTTPVKLINLLSIIPAPLTEPD